jgi:hypothetical protein
MALSRHHHESPWADVVVIGGLHSRMEQFLDQLMRNRIGFDFCDRVPGEDDFQRVHENLHGTAAQTKEQGHDLSCSCSKEHLLIFRNLLAAIL